jgi:hypothetical protein
MTVSGELCVRAAKAQEGIPSGLCSGDSGVMEMKNAAQSSGSSQRDEASAEDRRSGGAKEEEAEGVVCGRVTAVTRQTARSAHYTALRTR